MTVWIVFHVTVYGVTSLNLNGIPDKLSRKCDKTVMGFSVFVI